MKSNILESQRLKNENAKLMAQVIDQENVLNNKINVLMQEKYNLDSIVKQFTKSNTMLENMIYNSKLSSNKEGLGYDANKPPKREARILIPTKNISPKAPTKLCSYCNKNGHESLFCKAKEGVIKGKYKWMPKEVNVAQKNSVKNANKQPKNFYHQEPIQFQPRNSKNVASTSTINTRQPNVPRRNVVAQSSNNNAYIQGQNDHMPRNVSHYNARSSRHALNANMHSRCKSNNNHCVHHANIDRRNDYYHAYTRNDRFMPRRNPSHISKRNQAFRNLHVNNNVEYPIPRFIHDSSHLPYDLGTNGPLRKLRGTNQFY